MPTDKQRETSRANGSKSHGPVTDEGKSRSSQNALKHGLYAATPETAVPPTPPPGPLTPDERGRLLYLAHDHVTLPGEPSETFLNTLTVFLQRFQPMDPVEYEQVEFLAFSAWQMRRAMAAQRLHLRSSMYDHTPDECLTPEGDQLYFQALYAVGREAPNPHFIHLQRLQSHWRRQYRATLSILHDLQQWRPTPQEPPQPAEEKSRNEPQPQVTPVKSTAPPAPPQSAAELRARFGGLFGSAGRGGIPPHRTTVRKGVQYVPERGLGAAA